MNTVNHNKKANVMVHRQIRRFMHSLSVMHTNGVRVNITTLHEKR